ncbi:MAG: radical SAM protein, partial [Candidatus Latescibacteria bacterium]|nr:radical SAM protein [Candidatus Latescibacterota bacterium]
NPQSYGGVGTAMGPVSGLTQVVCPHGTHADLMRSAYFSGNALQDLPRQYYRFGLPRQLFRDWLQSQPAFDLALVQTVMTFWYLGVREVIEDIRARSPRTRIVLGGVYATLCPDHAADLGADLVVQGEDLEALWNFADLPADPGAPPLWEAYPDLQTGVVKLTEGCPFRCTYCSVPQVGPRFSGHRQRASGEIDRLAAAGVRRIAFYDDALLFKAEELFLPFLDELIDRHPGLELHTPNALNARFITPQIARLMVRAGFKTFYLGFESSAYAWQKKTGGKVYSSELDQAVGYLVEAGADPRHIAAYLIIAHPGEGEQDTEASMHFAHQLGIRLTLSEFSPIPGTPDGERCRQWVDLDEPLWHNKTAFPLAFLGAAKINRLKDLAKRLNRSLS